MRLSKTKEYQNKYKRLYRLQLGVEKTNEEVIILEKLWDLGICPCGCKFLNGNVDA